MPHRTFRFSLLRIFLVFCLLLLCLPLNGSGGNHTFQPPVAGTGSRGSTCRVLKPSADGAVTFSNESVSLDASHMQDGYVMLKWAEPTAKVKLQITGPEKITYTCTLPSDGTWHTFPMMQGNGEYTVNVFRNVYENQYVQVFSQTLDVTVADDLLPFLYPNEFVNFDENTQAVLLSQTLAQDSDTDLDVISSVFYYVVTNIRYDYDKAAVVKSGYIPSIDDTLTTGTGICFDYAALMSCMLRSQQIPVRLDIGYAGDIYHAWISVWTREQGWIYNLIEFNGTSWNMMDPTFTSTDTGGGDLNKYINNKDSYFIKYTY